MATKFLLNKLRYSSFKEDPPWLGPTGKIFDLRGSRLAKNGLSEASLKDILEDTRENCPKYRRYRVVGLVK